MRRQSSAANLALVILTVVGLAGPAPAGEQVPFKGSLEGDVTVTPNVPPTVPPSLKVAVTAMGHATHLGQFVLDVPHVVIPAYGTADGFYEFTSANGDTLKAHFTGIAVPIAPGILYIEETATIMGGTGRFAGASGSFTSERLYDMLAATTLGSFVGTISTPGP